MARTAGARPRRPPGSGCRRRTCTRASAGSVFDGQAQAFEGVTGALKYNVWHSLERRALVSVGLEATPPLGREDAWEVEPFVAFGANPGGALVVQGEVQGRWEEAEGFGGMSYRLGAGRALGRFAPMLEAG